MSSSPVCLQQTALERADSVAPRINEKIAAYNGAAPDQGRLRLLADELMSLLRDADLVYTQRFQPKFVNVHSSNRHGDGLDAGEVQSLLATILSGGWSWDETGKALGVQMPPVGTPENKLQKEFMMRLHDRSQGLLATPDPEQVQILSLCCSHTTAGLACVAGSAVCANERLEAICQNGRFSLAKLREIQPLMADAVDRGLQFTIIRWPVEQKCPELMALLSEAGNMQQAAARQESEWQVILLMHRQAAATPDLDWGRMVAKVASTRPAHADHVEGYAKFVRVHAGGREGQVLEEVGAYMKHMAHKRRVRGATFAALAEVELPMAPHYIPAMLKAMYAAPGKFVKEGESRLFAAPEIQQAGGKLKPWVLKASALMTEARELARAVGVTVSDRGAKALGDLDVGLVMHVHQKSKGTACLTDVAWAFHKSLEALVGPAVDVPSPPASWGTPPTPPQAAEGAPKASSAMRELPNPANVTMELARKGFKVGGTAVHRGSGEQGRISAICATAVQIGDVEVDPFKVLDEYNAVSLAEEDRQTSMHQ